MFNKDFMSIFMAMKALISLPKKYSSQAMEMGEPP